LPEKSMTSFSNTFLWARVLRPHGFGGQILISLSEPGAKKMKKPSSVFVDHNGSQVPYFIEKLQMNSNSAILKLEGINTEGEAGKLTGVSLFLDVSFKQKNFSSNVFEELQGYSVKDKNLGILGIITEIKEFPQQYIATMLYNGKEVLFPLNEEVIIGIDKNARILDVDLPSGLLDVYL
jgi:16S rRNA processing protein RimM